MENKTKPYFIPILRLFDLIPNDVWEENPHKKEYVEKLIKCLENEGYVVDAKLVNERLRAINGEEIAWAVMDEKMGKCIDKEDL
jgi:hypothetical protein